MENIIQETKFILKKYNLKANKNLGQNFLINREVLETIVSSAQIGDKDLVIEIGPGLGTLTEFLLEKTKKVICVEIDKNMINVLQDRFALYNNIEIINEDILKLNLNEIIENEKQKHEIKNVKIVANLPYYITTPIVMKLLEDRLKIESITIMIQKEVADRLIDKPGGKNCGAITYSINYYAEPEGIMDVDKSSFIPEPEVTSKVLKLKIRNTPKVQVDDPEKMFKIIKCAFLQRRKTLLNALVLNNVCNNKEEAAKVLTNAGIDLNIRGEKLTLEDYAKLSNEII